MPTLLDTAVMSAQVTEITMRLGLELFLLHFPVSHMLYAFLHSG
jgi:hypothetical protein